jgi:hypothetical protein
MWSAVLAPGLPHSAQMVALPSLSIWRLFALYMGSLYGDVISLMLLPPLLRCGCSLVCYSGLRFVPPTFHSSVLLAAGLFRVEHHSPFVSLGNAAQ